MLQELAAWSPTGFPDVVVHARGRVPILEGERISGAIGRLLTRLQVTGGARVRITAVDDEFGSMLVQANLRVGRTPVRMQTLTRGRGDALPAVDRLQRQIMSALGLRQPHPWPDPARFPLTVPGPGALVRRKRYALSTTEPSAAAALLAALDYDAYLFTDAETREDAIVYRVGPASVKMVRQQRSRPTQLDAEAPHCRLTVNPRPAPILTEFDAARRLRAYGLPFVFFIDRDTARGRLLYRRYDTDLALVVPEHERSASPHGAAC